MKLKSELMNEIKEWITPHEKKKKRRGKKRQ